LLLSSTAEAGEIARALNAGADEFISRPCEPAVFIVRVRRLLRRPSPAAPPMIDVRGFTLNKTKATLLDRGVPVELTPRQFALAWLFFSSIGRMVSHHAIGTAIWGTGTSEVKHSIEQHIYKLRRKLRLGAARGVQIACAYTAGYYLERCDMLEVPASTAATTDRLVAIA
jgi:DNA-binding response OmpR family regulator